MWLREGAEPVWGPYKLMARFGPVLVSITSELWIHLDPREHPSLFLTPQLLVLASKCVLQMPVLLRVSGHCGREGQLFLNVFGNGLGSFFYPEKTVFLQNPGTQLGLIFIKLLSRLRDTKGKGV